MGETNDINKVVRQFAEMERFFTGEFTVCASEPATMGADEGSAGAPQAAETRDEAVRVVSAVGESADEAMGSTAMTEDAMGDPAAALAAVAEDVARCDLCEELARTRTNVVPGEGNPRARLVFVGEAPGADEDAQGRPFVGRAGQLLTKIIAAMGLKRSEVFICNTLKCRPPGNRDPLAEEKANCRPFLRRQLEIIRPEVIVALGSHAAKSLLEVELPIGRIRGRFHEYYFSPDRPPVKLMPTYHPAYLLRNYSQENRRRVWEDMQKVMAELGLGGGKGPG